MTICSIGGCSREARKRTWCETHYARWRAHGDPMITKKRANGDGFIAAGYAAKQIDGVKKFDHVRIAESALGRPLPKGAVVHHADEDRSNNRNDNLVICPDRKYHNFLHMRIDAMKACGNANWRKCRHCRRYDDPLSLRIYTTKTGSTQAWHTACANKRAAEIRESRK
mgnify:CR=1 FL=1